MRSAQLHAVETLLERAMAEGIFPGAVLQVRQGGHVVHHHAYGWAQMLPRRRGMTPGAIFDLASLTKPVTATAVLQLWAAGVLDIDRPVRDYLPAFGAAGKEAVTLRHLLTHTAGLPAWVRLYLHTRSAREAWDYICRQPANGSPGERFEYSDLGYVVLGEVVARIGGMPLDRYVARCIAPVLGWRWTRFRPPLRWRGRCVATEAGNEYERRVAGAEGEGFAWRNGVIVGQVHDGNCHYTFGGVAGHAGLFGPADEVAVLGQAMLHGGWAPGGRLLDEGVAAEAVRDQIGSRLGTGMGLGWRCRLGADWMGERASPRAFGHTGFTGTSLLVEPQRALVVVLLTNRVHPRAPADATAIDALRRAVHDAVLEALG
ncbi:MAG: serine hydrolase [Armatimonadota bacterium]|nr:serine hydrolase [Armatimonadota bacterium]MDR7469187.1 serine hydrolase [Armatimonadota bacterium]MDR7538686.1 serine hydrolase [Armatimonadota bacterium]